MQHASPNATVHQLLAGSLIKLGVSDLFGLVGDANLFMVKSYIETGHGRYIPLTHEANAVLAAVGYAQVSGRIGVATITHGPALTNVVTALVEGVRAGVPLVVLCGDTPPGDLQHLQNIDQREVVASTGAGFVEMRAPHTAVVDLERAFRLAAHQRRPVVFNMRVDLQWQVADAGQPSPVLPPELPRASAAFEPLEEAVGMLASARRPLILAGRGAISAEARDAILALARRIEAPVATTLKAQGLFDGEPFNLGICGGLSHPAATDAIMKSDCILAFGASLSKHTTENGAYLLGKRVIQILPDIQENYRMDRPDLQLIGDPALTANAIIKLLDMAEIPGSGATDEDLRAALEAEARNFAVLPAAGVNAPGTVDMAWALRRLHQALSEDRVLVADLGRFVTTAWRNLPVNNPQGQVAVAPLDVGEVKAMQDQGVPVDYVIPEEGMLVFDHSFSVFAHHPDKALGLEYVNFVLSPEIQLWMTENWLIAPTNKTVKLPESVAKWPLSADQVTQAIRFDWDDANAVSGKLNDLWERTI